MRLLVLFLLVILGIENTLAALEEWDQQQKSSSVLQACVTSPADIVTERLVGKAVTMQEEGVFEKVFKDGVELFKKTESLIYWNGPRTDSSAGIEEWREFLTKSGSLTQQGIPALRAFYPREDIVRDLEKKILVGFVWVNLPDPAIEIYKGGLEMVWVLDPACRRQGYGHEATQGYLYGEVAFCEKFDFLYASIRQENSRSIELAKKLGFGPWQSIGEVRVKESLEQRKRLLFRLEKSALQ